MDVLPIISDGFNIYFPMAILGLCLGTYFSLGARLLRFVGFQQFVDDDDDITADLTEEGRELIKRGGIFCGHVAHFIECNAIYSFHKTKS